MIFKKIRSTVGRLFDESQQMQIVMFLSDIFWGLRKYFLSVVIEYPEELLNNWRQIKNKSSQDKERNFTVYQLIKMHNKIFQGQSTNIIVVGTDRGGTLKTISNFTKEFCCGNVICFFFHIFILSPSIYVQINNIIDLFRAKRKSSYFLEAI